MESEGGGVVTPRRLTSQHSTLRETFLATDLAESLNNLNTVNNNNSDISLGNPRPVSNLTLGAVLNSSKKSPPPNNVVVRTLLEIIRNDETLIGGGSSTSNSIASKNSWKSFKDRLKLKRASNHQNQNPNSHRWAPLSPVPQSDVLPSSRSMIAEAMNAHRNSLQAQRLDTDEISLREVFNGGSPRNGGSFRLSEALAAEREQIHQSLSGEVVEGNGSENRDNNESPNHGNNNEEDEQEREEQPGSSAPTNQPVRMSLMDLLEESEQQFEARGPIYRFDDNEENEEEAEEEAQQEEEDIGKEVHSCCVCMVRHKGAAFIPCGHTFCRKCSRELWVQRGNCPLCNNFILEILDIF